MKSRRVMVTLELTTARPLTDLRQKILWEAWAGMEVHQIQVNVIRPEKTTTKRKARKKS